MNKYDIFALRHEIHVSQEVYDLIPQDGHAFVFLNE